MSEKTQSSNLGDIGAVEDIEPPVGCHLSGRYKRSFAYKTLKDRLPIILTTIIDRLSRNKDEIARKYGSDSLEDIKKVVGRISKLKNELVTNKPLIAIDSIPGTINDDALLWTAKINELSELKEEIPTWYNTVWLISECYMYRRIAQEFALTNNLKMYDPFESLKQDSFFKAVESISYLSDYIMKLTNELNTLEQQETFIKLLKLDLWGNRCDLSLSAGTISSQDHNPLQILESLDKEILIDHSKEVWTCLNKNVQCGNNNSIIDIVLDNAGYELFTDLCLAIFLTHKHFANKIRFYVKKYPWFISDVTRNDFNWFIETMMNFNKKHVQLFGQYCEKCLKSGTWTIEEESFWTEPFDYSEMKSRQPSLYNKLSEAVLVIFKGDLNYRKLLGDINWDYTTNMHSALRNFKPSNLLSLRTIKADVCVGLPSGKAHLLKKEDSDWMVTGRFGLIQACLKSDK